MLIIVADGIFAVLFNILGHLRHPRRHAPTPNAHITVRDLTMAYGSFVLMRDLDFTVAPRRRSSSSWAAAAAGRARCCAT